MIRGMFSTQVYVLSSVLPLAPSLAPSVCRILQKHDDLVLTSSELPLVQELYQFDIHCGWSCSLFLMADFSLSVQFVG